MVKCCEVVTGCIHIILALNIPSIFNICYIYWACCYCLILVMNISQLWKTMICRMKNMVVHIGNGWCASWQVKRGYTFIVLKKLAPDNPEDTISRLVNLFTFIKGTSLTYQKMQNEFGIAEEVPPILLKVVSLNKRDPFQRILLSQSYTLSHWKALAPHPSFNINA